MIPLTNLFKHWTYQVFAPGTVLREKYEAFKSLLRHDKRAHELMAELEEIYYDQTKVDFKVIEEKYDRLARCVSGIVENLAIMCPSRYLDLRDYFKKFDFYIRFMLAPPEFGFSPPFTIPLKEIPPDGHTLVGGKALNLGVIEKDLQLRIPKGFVITTNAFYYFIEFNDLWKPIDERLSRLDINSTSSLDAVSNELVEIILNAQIPQDIEEAIINAFKSIQDASGKDTRLAIRSSAVGEDTGSSFAGQYRTVLNVKEDGILNAYKDVIASKYAPRALYYRINYGLSDFETPMAVIGLEMIDAAASGVMYTKDLESLESKNLAIHSIWGLGELLVGGEMSPDIVKVAKEEKPRIVQRKIGDKTKQMVFSQNNMTEIIPVDDDKEHLPSLDDAPALVLADWGMRLENHYKEPQDIEWCTDNEGHLFLLQSRPLRLEEDDLKPLECNFENIINAVLVSGGERASSGIGAGKVFRVDRESDLEKFPEDAVLVARNALPQYVKVMNRLSAVVTDTGSIAGHFSSVAREFGVPTLVNTGVATANLPHGKEVTVHADGKVVYDGIVQSMLESPCARRDLISDSPYARKMKYIMSFISPLKLIDPEVASFVSHGVRSLHDIIRFSHEKAIQEMFHMGKRRIRKIGGSKKLLSGIPMLFYVLDVGGGLREDLADEKAVRIDDIVSVPMRQVFKGLSHPDIHWGDFTHFNWEEYDRIVMSGGIISAKSAMLASYAVVSSDYLNLNLRFGYHFVILDAICGDQAEDNYILFRFSGGGADISKRMLRADFLHGILDRLGFKVDMKNDLVDGQLKGDKKKTVEQKLDIIGRLLGATRLMDMYLKDSSMVEKYVGEFMNGRYHFASIEE
jgi:pyruvate,water dikinase